jgi:hypothetical protein
MLFDIGTLSTIANGTIDTIEVGLALLFRLFLNLSREKLFFGMDCTAQMILSSSMFKDFF